MICALPLYYIIRHFSSDERSRFPHPSIIILYTNSTSINNNQHQTLLYPISLPTSSNITRYFIQHLTLLHPPPTNHPTHSFHLSHPTHIRLHFQPQRRHGRIHQNLHVCNHPREVVPSIDRLRRCQLCEDGRGGGEVGVPSLLEWIGLGKSSLLTFAAVATTKHVHRPIQFLICTARRHTMPSWRKWRRSAWPTRSSWRETRLAERLARLLGKGVAAT